MLNNFLLIFLGGGIGSVLRFGISLLMMSVSKTVFPVATLLSNVISCTVLGVVVYLMQDKINSDNALRFLLVTGFCGGFSTFSAFSFETVELIRSGNAFYAVLNIVVSLSSCLGIIYLLAIRSNA